MRQRATLTMQSTMETSIRYFNGCLDNVSAQLKKLNNSFLPGVLDDRNN